MVNVNGSRDWSAATKDCPEFLGSLTQVKYFSTNLITVRAHRGHTWSEATQNPCKFYQLSVNPKIQKSSIFKRTSQKFQGFNKKIFVMNSWFTWISGLLDYYKLDEIMIPNYQLQSTLSSVNATAAVTGA